MFVEKGYPKTKFVDRTLGIDLDRFVFDTKYYFGIYLDVAYETANIDPDEVTAYRARVEAEKKSFHTDVALRTILDTMDDTRARDETYLTPEQHLNHIHAAMLTTDKIEVSKLFLPGAKAFIDRLASEGVFADGRAFFFTHGTEPGQLIKTIRAELNVHPIVITKDTDKGEYVKKKWVQKDVLFGGYVIRLLNGGQIVAERFAHGDDKLFTLPEDAQLFLKLPEGKEPPDAESLPNNVKVVDDFEPMLRYLGLNALKP